LTAKSLLAFEHLGLHFIKAELQLPPLMVERHHFGGRVLLRIYQRGEQSLRPKPLALVSDGSRLESLGKAGVLFA
jgi:hypothetical protein